MGALLPYRAEALAMGAGGESAAGVARRFGCSRAVVALWAKMAGMVLQRSRIGGIAGVSEHRRREPLVFDCPAEWLDGRGRLTEAGRVLIMVRSRERVPQAVIARELGVHPSTVSRELRRCRSGGYSARVAHQQMVAGRARPKPRKLCPGTPLWDEVVSRLNDKHSPEQIAQRLVVDHPHDQSMRVSHETIYQALYVQGAGALRHELSVEKALRSGRKTRLPRSKLAPRSRRPWVGQAPISQRPAEVADRAIPGHGEGDLVIGTEGRSALVTLNERNTRYTMLTRLAMHDSLTVTDALIAMAKRLPETLLKTITWDQGVEMADHQRFEIATGVQVFFCDPHAPWQRPTNENSNGLIRDFYPKSTNFNHVTDEDIAHTEDLLNTRPRKVLQWATPAEKLAELLDVAPIT